MNLLTHLALFERVAQRLHSMTAATDHQLLVRWQIIRCCQKLMSVTHQGIQEKALAALESFCQDGISEVSDKAFAALAKEMEPVLPALAPELSAEVAGRLRQFEARGPQAVAQALEVLSKLKAHLNGEPKGVLIAGIQHRLGLVIGIVQDTGRPINERIRAASAILYLEEVEDVIPDSLGLIGLVDDDHGLKAVLKELAPAGSMHWCETLTEFWDTLPFLRGLQLKRDDQVLGTTWLDRINAHHFYDQFGKASSFLVLVQPSIECSLLHPLITLTGWLIYDALTTAENLVEKLKIGQTYLIDGQFRARYKGKEGQRIKLEFDKLLTDHLNPSFARRMEQATGEKLASNNKFREKVGKESGEPLQKFFGWDAPIGMACIPSKIILVTSRNKAYELLNGVTSNGVDLGKNGMVHFASRIVRPSAAVPGLILVLPDLNSALEWVRAGLSVSAIVFDGYAKLEHGPHWELPAINIPLILWTQVGCIPSGPVPALSGWRRLYLRPEEIAETLELDGCFEDATNPSRQALWEAATGSAFTLHIEPYSAEEQQVLECISAFFALTRDLAFPMDEQVHLVEPAKHLCSYITDVPAQWSDIRDFVENWHQRFIPASETKRVQSYRTVLEQLRPAVEAIVSAIALIREDVNTRGLCLPRFLASKGTEACLLVCSRPDQVKIANLWLENKGLKGLRIGLLRDLRSCQRCLVLGKYHHGHDQIQARTPSEWTVLCGEQHASKWKQFQRTMGHVSGASMIGALGTAATTSIRPSSEPSPPPQDLVKRMGNNGQVAYVIWLVGEYCGRVLSANSRVQVWGSDRVWEKKAKHINPDDRVLFGLDQGSSPANQFTQEIVMGIEASHPQVVAGARAWRLALRKLKEERGWRWKQLGRHLHDAGIDRDPLTYRLWLKTEQAAPILPRSYSDVFGKILALCGSFPGHSLEAVVEACENLRRMKRRAAKMLFESNQEKASGDTVSALPSHLVEHILAKVKVFEVEAVSRVLVPKRIQGWWVSPEFIANLEQNGNWGELLGEDSA